MPANIYVPPILNVGSVYYNLLSVCPNYQEVISDAEHSCGYVAINKRISNEGYVNSNYAFSVIMNEFFGLVHELQKHQFQKIITKMVKHRSVVKRSFYIIGENAGYTFYTTIDFNIDQLNGFALEKALAATPYFSMNQSNDYIKEIRLSDIGYIYDEWTELQSELQDIQIIEADYSRFNVRNMDAEDVRLHNNRELYRVNSLIGR